MLKREKVVRLFWLCLLGPFFFSLVASKNNRHLLTFGNTVPSSTTVCTWSSDSNQCSLIPSYVWTLPVPSVNSWGTYAYWKFYESIKTCWVLTSYKACLNHFGCAWDSTTDSCWTNVYFQYYLMTCPNTLAEVFWQCLLQTDTSKCSTIPWCQWRYDFDAIYGSQFSCFPLQVQHLNTAQTLSWIYDVLGQYTVNVTGTCNVAKALRVASSCTIKHLNSTAAECNADTALGCYYVNGGGCDGSLANAYAMNTPANLVGQAMSVAFLACNNATNQTTCEGYTAGNLPGFPASMLLQVETTAAGEGHKQKPHW